MTAPDWRDAACRDLDTEDFYPEEGPGMYSDIRAAKAVCEQCPVRLACLEVAITNRESGVWGGTTEPERRRIIRNRKRNGEEVPTCGVRHRSPCGTPGALRYHQRHDEPIDEACRLAGALYKATWAERRAVAS